MCDNNLVVHYDFNQPLRVIIDEYRRIVSVIYPNLRQGEVDYLISVIIRKSAVMLDSLLARANNSAYCTDIANICDLQIRDLLGDTYSE